ncbi:hypothetical protein KSP40_PGU010708 [Platanthera guangdongensis]|uniref:2-methoxy-6-polyprenyl-1,4-benzoquinol methylase, mitochondrial n=1 Tax=Platanthera guangdongensis TaxID=2320717 RepID=A0ABR2MUR4_9ASPA
MGSSSMETYEVTIAWRIDWREFSISLGKDIIVAWTMNNEVERFGVVREGGFSRNQLMEIQSTKGSFGAVFSRRCGSRRRRTAVKQTVGVCFRRPEKRSKKECFESPLQLRTTAGALILSLPVGFKEVPEEEKSKLVGNVFNSVATNYDLMNDLMSGGLHRLWKDRLVTKLHPFPGMKHLDVAGGTGENCKPTVHGPLPLTRNRSRPPNSVASPSVTLFLPDARRNPSFDGSQVTIGQPLNVPDSSRGATPTVIAGSSLLRNCGLKQEPAGKRASKNHEGQAATNRAKGKEQQFTANWSRPHQLERAGRKVWVISYQRQEAATKMLSPEREGRP